MQALKQGYVSNIYSAAQMYDTPDSTLWRRVKGIDARCDSIPVNRKVTTIEKSTLIEWILSID